MAETLRLTRVPRPELSSWFKSPKSRIMRPPSAISGLTASLSREAVSLTSLPWHFTTVTLFPNSSFGALSTSHLNESLAAVGPLSSLPRQRNFADAITTTDELQGEVLPKLCSKSHFRMLPGQPA